MDKVIVVTGGSRGIGAARALAAGKAGERVVVNFTKRREGPAAVVRELGKRGATAVAVQADVASEADVARLFAETDRRFGRLDALVKHAGIVGRSSRFADLATGDL